MERLMDTSAKADAAKEEIENPSARKTIKQIASINTKKIAGPEGTGAEDYANLDSVDISKLGEIGKRLIWYLSMRRNMDIPGGK